MSSAGLYLCRGPWCDLNLITVESAVQQYAQQHTNSERYSSDLGRRHLGPHTRHCPFMPQVRTHVKPGEAGP
jgi:hypothetical protein